MYTMHPLVFGFGHESIPIFSQSWFKCRLQCYSSDCFNMFGWQTYSLSTLALSVACFCCFCFLLTFLFLVGWWWRIMFHLQIIFLLPWHGPATTVHTRGRPAVFSRLAEEKHTHLYIQLIRLHYDFMSFFHPFLLVYKHTIFHL